MKLLTRLSTNLLILLLVAGCASAPEQSCQHDIELMQNPPELGQLQFESVSRFNTVRETAVWDMLGRVGCDELVRQKVQRSRHHNLVCKIQGDTPETLVIGAHYDRFGSGQGIADNWSGIVILERLAHHYAANKPLRTLHFVAFADEEIDMAGSRQYVRALRRSGDLPVLMLNVDTIGVSTLSLDRRADDRLNCLTFAIADQLGTEVRTTLVRDMTGDWESFSDAGVPILTFHSVNQHEMKKLHTYHDKASLVDERRLNESFRVIAETLSALNHSVETTISLSP